MLLRHSIGCSLRLQCTRAMLCQQVSDLALCVSDSVRMRPGDPTPICLRTAAILCSQTCNPYTVHAEFTPPLAADVQTMDPGGTQYDCNTPEYLGGRVRFVMAFTLPVTTPMHMQRPTYKPSWKRTKHSQYWHCQQWHKKLLAQHAQCIKSLPVWLSNSQLRRLTNSKNVFKLFRTSWDLVLAVVCPLAVNVTPGLVAITDSFSQDVQASVQVVAYHPPTCNQAVHSRERPS
jgi:hypothetical protein